MRLRPLPLLSSSRRFLLIASGLTLLCGAAPLSAQLISYTTPGGTYTQDFNTLAASGTRTWTDGVTLPGWSAYFAAVAGAPTQYVAYDGSTSTAGLRSFGTLPSSPNRALGMGPGSAFGNTMIGVSFSNDTGGTLTDLNISYKGELWRGVGAGDKDMIVSYQIGSPANLNSGVWTVISDLTFSVPQTAGGTAYDGTAAANSELLSAHLSGLQWESGQTLTLRFFQNNDLQNKHIAIDDFSFSATAIPEPSTWALLALAGVGIHLARKRSLPRE